jgi:hypothetical protein
MRRATNIVILSVLLVAVVCSALLILGRDSGKPPIVYGNLSARDISQIQRAVHHELWRDTFPNFSAQTFKTLPVHLRAALTNHVAYIATDGQNIAYALWGTNFAGRGTNWETDHGYYLTNGPTGWRCQYPYFYIVPD